jgi:hypothetical protein
MGGFWGIVSPYVAGVSFMIYAAATRYASSDTSPAGRSNSNVFSVIETIV